MASKREHSSNDTKNTDSETPVKKAKIRENPFTEKGLCDNEVTLRFDDGKELYVSKDLLIYASPVFERMFESDFKEKHTGVVEMAGKDYTDFLNFLLALYPGAVFDFNKADLLPLIPLIEVYDVDRLRTVCNEILRGQIEKKLQDISGCYGKSRGVIQVLTVLQTISPYTQEYTSVMDEMLKGFRNLNACYLVGNDNENNSSGVSECMELFSSLPIDIQAEVLKNRIKAVEKAVW